LSTTFASPRAEHLLALLHVLHHFLKTHPEAKPLQHPSSKQYFDREPPLI
jgi:hypothetical protein